MTRRHGKGKAAGSGSEAPSSTSMPHMPMPTISQEDTSSFTNTLSSDSENESPPPPSSAAVGSGTTNISPHPEFTDIGLMMKEVNDTLGDLQLLGVSHDVPLPELVLVGDQSSGKSSLMSALARLDLPTSSGICTRCPFHIHMKPSKDNRWSEEYEYRPNPNRAPNGSDVTKKNPFAPWVRKQGVDTKFFKTIYENDPLSIEAVLRWAQIATLNPSQDPQQYVPGEGKYATATDLETATTEAKFSPNVVFFEMKGLDFPSLSFYDLPGIFATAERKTDDYLVDVVENLTREYVLRKKAIIMLAVPMDQDIDNSRALRIVRDANADDRTIGVLTKADRVDFTSQEKNVANWLAVLKGAKQTVGHGFFTTSLPPNEPNPTEFEKEFFRVRWPREFDQFMHQFGVVKLRFYVREKLAEAFSSSLPETKEELGVRLQDLETQLSKLPELPTNVEHEVRMGLKHFSASVKAAVGSLEFDQKTKNHIDQLYTWLVQRKPSCDLDTTPVPKVVIELSDSSDDEPRGAKRPAPRDLPAPATPKRQRLNVPVSTPVKSESPVFRFHPSPAKTIPSQPSQPAPRPKISILQIRDMIKRTTRGGFGDVVPFEVYETLCLQAIASWENPLQAFLESVSTYTAQTVTEVLGESLGKFSSRVIFKESKEYLATFLDAKKANQTLRIIHIYKNEKYRAGTINESALKALKEKEKQSLVRSRLFIRAKAAGLIDEEYEVKAYDQLSPEEKAAEEKWKSTSKWAHLQQDGFTKEIDVAAAVMSYYSFAATRFVDAVYMDINAHLLRLLREGALENYLDKKLGLDPSPNSKAPENYDRLMDEEESITQKRNELKRARDKFKTAIQKIEAHEMPPLHPLPQSGTPSSFPVATRSAATEEPPTKSEDSD
ncbi:P-loop containing nucleoside triphosphate hydrolase protein [Poronia punctata]|nr:P-loop containing nucleoside triphosphate hydrolase protein [Poronia punctata]